MGQPERQASWYIFIPSTGNIRCLYRYFFDEREAKSFTFAFDSSFMHSNLRKYGLIWSLFFFGCILGGCNATRHLEPGQLLLKSEVQIHSDRKLAGHADRKAIQLKPNRRMIWPKTYLHLRSMALTLEHDSSWVKRQLLHYGKFRIAFAKTVNWIRDDLGEQPVLVNLPAIRTDSLNLVNTYFANGFFNPTVNYHIQRFAGRRNQQKANIVFAIQGNAAYVIDTVHYQFGDTTDIPDSLRQQIREDYRIPASLLKSGQRYIQSNLIKERTRATETLRNAGYYTFSQSMISMAIDTFYQPESTNPDSLIRQIRLYVNVREVPPKYRIRSVTALLRASSDPENLSETFKDEIFPGNLKPRDRERIPVRRLSDSLKVNFVVSSTLIEKINYNFIARRIHFRPEYVFSQQDARLTQQRLQALGMFQYVVAKYTILDSTNQIDVTLDMRMAPNYQIKAGLESFSNDITTSSNLPSIGANFSIRNKNAFRRSELLEIGLNGNVGFYGSQLAESQFSRTFYELSANINISFPTLLVPFLLKNDFSRLNPSTIFSGSALLESLREYDRTTTGINLRYRWNHQPFRTTSVSQLTPVSIDFIDIEIKDSTFQAAVDSLPTTLQRDYESRFSSGFSYSFTHSNYLSNRIRPTHFYRANFEIGGNLPYLLDIISPADSSSKDNLLFDDIFYGQYLKASLEIRHFIPVKQGIDLVFRGFAGASRAYNFTPVVPYESRFFSGGTNSMRGWRSNTLGPGRASSDSLNTSSTNSTLLAPGGELALELNAELRMDVMTYLEIAAFTDLGNVWFNQPVEGLSFESAKSNFNGRNFRLGWDAGLGFRFDFSFLLLRFDIGQQLYAPDVGWVLKSVSDLGTGRTQFNIGIGYPF